MRRLNAKDELTLEGGVMLLIPFAKKKDTGKLVDVYAVQRGRQCDCVCISCGQPLLARQGSNEWHFAHDAAFESLDGRVECDFSWTQAFKLFYTQLLLQGHRIFLPEYLKHYQLQDESVVISLSHTIEYQQVTETCSDVDLVIHVNDHKLGVIFSHTASLDVSHYEQSDMDGVIYIQAPEQIDYKGAGFESFSAYLEHIIQATPYLKSWVFHRRELKCQRKELALQEDKKKKAMAREEARQRVEKEKQEANRKRLAAEELKRVQQAKKQYKRVDIDPAFISGPVNAELKCINCKIRFDGHWPRPKQDKCPGCKSGLNIRKLRSYITD